MACSARRRPVRARDGVSKGALSAIWVLSGALLALGTCGSLAAQPETEQPPRPVMLPVGEPRIEPSIEPSIEPASQPAVPAGSNPLAKLPLIGRFFRGPEDEDSAPAGKEGAVAPHYGLEVMAPEPLARQIRTFTLLGRWRRRADYDPSQLPLFIRKADAEVRELLAAEGYFAAEVKVTQRGDTVRVEVLAGPRTTVNLAEVVLDGEIAAAPNEDLRERIRRDWLMPEGTLFRSADWENAKSGMLGALRDGGFLRSRIVESEALVDLERTAASLRLSVDSGPRLRFGDIEVGGLQRYPQSVVEGLRPFGRGDPYDAIEIGRFQTRLNGAGWFSTVNVRPDVQALERDPELQEVPIRVDVVERQAKRWSLGGGYDTERGFNVLAGWEHLNVWGLGIQTFNGIELDLERQLLYSTWDTPQDAAGLRWQFGARAEHRDVQNDLVDAASVFASHNRRRGDIETALSLQYQFERQSIVFAPDQEQLYDNRAAVLGWSWTQRKLDSPIFPTKGYIASVQFSGASESLGSVRSFTRAYALGYALLPLKVDGGEEFGRIALRGEIGLVAAGGREGIPSANLFRTGGAKSVRGYSSQSLGVPVGQATVGGRVLGVASVEYQHILNRDVALAVFYDRGNAADTWADLKTVAGYGVGVRWRTPVGPLNVDVARGDAVDEWRLHFSIGVVF